MPLLAILTNRLSQNNGEINEIRARITRLRRRRDDLNALRRDFVRVTNEHVRAVNVRLQGMVTGIENGIHYSNRERALQNLLTEGNEQPLGTDRSLTASDQEIERELSSVENQIAEAERELARAMQRSDDLNNSIQAEERRMQEDRA